MLEIGSGNGDTGAAVLAANKAQHYVGIDLDAGVCAIARDRLSHVVQVDLDSIDVRVAVGGDFDAVIASEVLEHLVDPWSVVADWSGGLAWAACSSVRPRTSCRSTSSATSSRAGSTTPGAAPWTQPTFGGSHQALPRRCSKPRGSRRCRVAPVTAARRRSRVINRVTGGCLKHLFMRQILSRRSQAGDACPATPAAPGLCCGARLGKRRISLLSAAMAETPHRPPSATIRERLIDAATEVLRREGLRRNPSGGHRQARRFEHRRHLLPVREQVRSAADRAHNGWRGMQGLRDPKRAKKKGTAKLTNPFDF